MAPGTVWSVNGEKKTWTKKEEKKMGKPKFGPKWFRRDRLTLIRNHLGMSKSEFAEWIGVHRAIISHWELGRSAPSIENLIVLAGMTRCPIDWYIEPKALDKPPAPKRLEG
jgi:DNA-binding transcriptional regulator YiaG